MSTFLLQGLRDKTTLNLQNESDGSSRDPDEEANDCLKDRKNALEDKSVSSQQKKLRSFEISNSFKN